MPFDPNVLWAKLHFSSSERLRLYRKISKMLTNGLPLLKILEQLHERESDNGRKPKEPVALILDDCRHMVQNGRMLADALAPWVPQTEQMIIMAGEQSGHLEQSLLAVIYVVQAEKKIKNVIVSSAAYPIAVFSMIILYIYIFGTRVIPEFSRIVDATTWGGAAKSLYLMSLFVQQWMLYLVIVLVAVIVAIIVSMPRWCGNVRVYADRFVPYSIYRLMAGSSFLLAFSALQSSGITVEKSLVRMSNLAHPWLRERLDGALMGIKSGLNCGEALKNAGYGFPSDEVIDDLCVYADYKGFSEALKILAEEWMEDGVERISMQMKVLNSIAIFALAMVIAWLVTGFFGIQQEISSLTRVR